MFTSLSFRHELLHGYRYPHCNRKKCRLVHERNAVLPPTGVSEDLDYPSPRFPFSYLGVWKAGSEAQCISLAGKTSPRANIIQFESASGQCKLYQREAVQILAERASFAVDVHRWVYLWERSELGLFRIQIRYILLMISMRILNAGSLLNLRRSS